MSRKEAIAIVGVGCKLPGSISNIDQFWSVVANGTDCLTKIPADRWDADTIASKEFKLNNRIGGFLDNIDQFDPQFFGMSPKEAAQIDPQQRLVLQVAMEALEDANMSFKQIKGTNAGVFIGSSSNDYQRTMSMGEINQFTTQGTNSSFLSNRLSYFLDISGPSLTVNTACSSSLVAIHLGAQSIWRDECRVAIVGGVNIIANQIQSLDYGEAGLLNTEVNGRCYSFDDRASGYVRAEGAGILILKNLSDAIKDRDEIHSIILNTGTNQNGQTPQGITSPYAALQESLLNNLMEGANVVPSEIGYFECHGTGTQMGDANETEAIGKSIGMKRESPLPVGSVKSNIGHLEGASGVCGLIKTIACIKNKMIAPICPAGFEKLNPKLEFEQLNLNVPTALTEWNDEQRLAVVNSFGVGGSNASILLANYRHCLKNSSDSVESNGSQEESGISHMEVFSVSVNSNDKEHLKQRVQDMIDYLNANGEQTVLKDICYTSNVRTNQLSNRVSFMIESVEDLKDKLQQFLSVEEDDLPSTVFMKDSSSAETFGTKKLAFVCSGQGQQWISMGKELFDSSPIFRAEFMKCSSLFQALSGWSIIDKVFDSRNTEAIHDTWLAQPAIFATQVGICAVLKSAGVVPASVIGHSLGEVVAAYLAGILSIEDATKLMWVRSHLQNKTTGTGKMCIAVVSKEDILAVAERYSYTNKISIAGNNSTKCVGISGSSASMDAFMNIMKNEHIAYKPIRINAGFHSYLMDSIKDEFYSLFPKIEHRAPQIPFYSTTNGKLIDASNYNLLGVDYWWSNIRETVMFKEALGELVSNEQFDGFVEISSHPIISFFVNHMIRERSTNHFIVPTMSRDSSNFDTLMTLFSKLSVNGYEISWDAIYLPRRHMAIKLPGRRWNMDSYWVESTQAKVDRIDLPKSASLTRKLVSLTPSFEIRLDNPRFYYLADHRIQNQAIFPYALYLEVFYAAMSELKDQMPASHFELYDFEIKTALEIDAKFTNVVQINFSSDLTKFEIGSIVDTTVPIKWTIHASGKVAHVNSFKVKSTNNGNPLMNAINSANRIVKAKDFYRSITALGYNYGPSFQALVRSAILDSTSQVSELQLPSTSDLEKHVTSDFAFIHPSVMDGVFQSCFTPIDHKREGLWIPQTFEKMSANLTAPIDIRTPIYSITKITNFKDKNTFVCDIAVTKDNGEVICKFSNMTMKCIARPTQKDITLGEQLWRYQWKEGSHEGRVDINQMKLDGHFNHTLIFTGDEGSPLTKNLVEYIKENYNSSANNIVIVTNGESLTQRQSELGQVITSPLNKDANYSPLFNKLKMLNPGKFWSTVILPDFFKANVNQPTCESVEESYARLMYILQQASSNDFSGRITMISKSGQVVESSDLVDYTHYSLVGLLRTFSNENYNFYCSMIDIDNSTAPLDWMSELSCFDTKGEVAFRNGKRFTYDLVNNQSLGDAIVNSNAKADRRFQVDISDNGVIADMKINETKRHQPKAGQVEVKVDITSLNFRDILKTLGRDYDPNHLTTIGDEFAGTITAVGEGVTQFAVGDQVFGVFMARSMCSYITCPIDLVFKIPKGLTPEQACTIPITFLTAWYSIVVQANLRKGESILIHSAAGGVGLSAVQIARYIGAEIFVTVGTEDKREYMEKTVGIPSSNIMNSRNSSFYKDIMSKTNQRGVDVVLNSLSGELIDKSILSLANYGRFVEIGKKDIYADSKIGLLPFRNNLSYLAVDVAQMTVNRVAYLAEMMNNTLIPLFESKDLAPLPTNTFTISHVVQSVRHMSTGNHIGKNLVSWSDLEKATTNDLPIHLDSESTYLITGTGGLALVFAQKLANLNAHHLVFASKNGADSDLKKRYLDMLEEVGVKVEVKKCDLADRQQVNDLLSEYSSSLKGIFHTAGMLSDQSLQNQTLSTFNIPFHSKANSALHLHNCSMELNLKLDYFVTCGSIITPFGKPGQSNYATANRFVEGLTLDRQRQGLVGSCIHLAPIPEIGMSAEEKIAQGLRNVGHTPYDSLDAMCDGIAESISARAQDKVVVYCDIDVNKWMVAFPGFRLKKSIIKSLDPNYTPPVSPAALKGNDSIENSLKKIVSDIMEIKLEKIDASSNFKDLGLDSLLASELTNSIHKKFSVFVPSLSLLDRKSTIRSLVDKISPDAAADTMQPLSIRTEDEVVRKTIEKIVNKQSSSSSSTLQKKQPIPMVNLNGNGPIKAQPSTLKAQPIKAATANIAPIPEKRPIDLIPSPLNLYKNNHSNNNNNNSQSPIVVSPSPSSNSYVSVTNSPYLSHTLPVAAPLIKQPTGLTTADDYATAIYAIEPLAAPFCTDQQTVYNHYKDHTTESTFMRNVYKNCKIKERYMFVDSHDHMALNAMPSSKKNTMFADIVHDTVVKAGERILKNNNVDRSQISHVIGVTSTGIFAPSIDAMLCRALGLDEKVGRTMINFMGCGAAVIALRTAVAYANKRPGTYVLMMCVESSCTNMDLDPNDRGDIVSGCIFSDGCAASLITCQPRANLVGKLECIDDLSYLMPDSKHALEMFMGDRGIDLALRPELSACIEKHIRSTIESFLASHGMEVPDMDFWAIHPGGRRILEAVHQGLNLGPEEMAESYDVMKWYGNMVSCSAMYVLKRIIERIMNLKNENGKGLNYGMVMAFSPGASIEAMLLKMIK
ncbi:putative polyketide synthase [Heterostelium album PN500]|uniref:Putative polyketide synthase n=1 Tax=Heterostelium pallidum (strain ATCC 26659 / Pp 5 / PN500) TaxID=670386 RepID=D3AW22_HETP5|nr:putative polyketide synthase [Heterostelium album PN500]EFA86495.1 putative polyketide synthase [Heterostelium album PN500]|eukprot:XP_020438600.1 putative polyketide synthase [Heterostelium album PN500]